VFVIRFLQEKAPCTLRDIEMALNRALPGLQTPSLGLLQAVLVSYAVEADGLWNLRPEDSPSLRRAEMEAVSQSLVTLGTRLNYTIQRQESPYRLSLWQENGETQFAFYLLASSVSSRLLRQVEIPPSKSNLIVLPGGRAGLLAYKFDRDPTLAGLARRWRIVKFRHLRRLAGLPALSRDSFEKNITADPIEPLEQMKLF
jgi:hypothetical protein